jgi:uncharacterized protein (TIGR02453 family)
MLKSSTLKFLKGLKKNNHKSWFDANRPAYEAAKDDFRLFIQSVIDMHRKKDPDLNDLEARKCLFRINRDIRFSKDKTPYKTNFGASMDKGGKKSGLAGYYFHLEPGRSFFGGGIWMPEADVVKKIRQEIDYCHDEFHKIVSSKKFKSIYPELYTGEGVKLARLPQGFEKDNPAGEYLKFKSWLVLCNVSDAELTSKDLLKKTDAAFTTLQPFIKFLNRPLE